MKRRRRCIVCRELYEPDARVGSRQRACGSAACQRERHRRACQAWREGERPALEEERLRRRLGVSEGEVRLSVVRDECGPKTKVALEESLRLVSACTRDESQAKYVEIRRETLRLVDRARRDETAAGGPAP